jgi:hypothetical protein
MSDRIPLLEGDQRFAPLKAPRRVWAVAAVHGQADKLGALHDTLAACFKPGDRLVYLGNLIGHGGDTIATLNEALAFRRALLALPGLMPGDIVYLRGAQEEMLHKLQQIQFATDPAAILRWMLNSGLAPVIAAYGLNAEDAMASARNTMALTRWAGQLRAALRAHPGHEPLFTALKRAAITAPPQGPGALFVHTGVDTSRPLAAQGDSFWWAHAAFTTIRSAYEPFARIVRGYEPTHAGIVETPHTLSLDAGAGFGGRLTLACVSANGELIDSVGF